MDDDYTRETERESKYDDSDKKPSAFKAVLGKAIAALRADDDMMDVLREFEALDPNAIEKCTVEEARAQPTPTDAVKALLRKQGRNAAPEALVPGVSSVDGTIPGAAGELRSRIYTPEGDGPFGVILYFHGGGWVIADLDVYDGGARGLCKQSNAIVVSVDYRQAPEHKFPAAWDDALAAYRWLAQNATSINGDPDCLALAGESAGGCLALATAIAAHEQGLTLPLHVLAVYPVTQTGSLATPSYLENALAVPLSRAMVPWFLDKLLRSEEDKKDTRLDLIHADLRGLPPVTIINAMLDPLRSDGAMLEDALREAGVPVMRKDYSGVVHEFFGAAAVVGKAREAQQFAGQRLSESLN